MKQGLGAIPNLKKKNNQILAFLLFENNEIRMHQAIIWEVERDRVESTFSACF